MEGETSWITHWIDENSSNNWIDHPTENHYIDEFDRFSDVKEESSMDAILPDDLLERILSCLPIASIFRAASVNKRWRDIVISRRFLRNLPSSPKPWYFMFMCSEEPRGRAYDPIARKWLAIDLPCIEKSNWFVASSRGLVCFMDNNTRSKIYVCNPITGCYKPLANPPGSKYSDYNALAITTGSPVSCGYEVSLVKSNQAPGNFLDWYVSIHVYDSETLTWTTRLNERLTGWRSGDESIICDGVLYFVAYSTALGMLENRHGLIAYDLVNGSREGLLVGSLMDVPCLITCGRLMNMNEKLVMVGGMGKRNRPGVIKGIGIWTLEGREWEAISRMPQKFFQGFGELDDVFASSGSDDLIYVQSYGAPLLVFFDMKKRQWKWSHKCPVAKKFPLQLFTGFCFEPSLGIAP